MVPGTPWEGEISLGNFSGGPPEDNNELFSAPGGSGSVLGASREGSCVGERPFTFPAAAPEASGSEFGPQIGAKMEPPRPHF